MLFRSGLATREIEVAVGEVQLDLHARMLGQERRDKPREEIAADELARRHAHDAFEPRVGAKEPALGFQRKVKGYIPNPTGTDYLFPVYFGGQ